jgi:hypothetical protein
MDDQSVSGRDATIYDLEEYRARKAARELILVARADGLEDAMSRHPSALP